MALPHKPASLDSGKTKWHWPPRLRLDVANCDVKIFASSGLSWNMKSAPAPHSVHVSMLLLSLPSQGQVGELAELSQLAASTSSPRRLLTNDAKISVMAREFPLTPQAIAPVHSRLRRIATKLPAPE